MRLFIPMTAVAMLCTQACTSASLHPSFGQLYRDVNIAQQSAHPAHDVTVRGIEVNHAITKHDARLAPQQGGGGGPISTSTAGIPALH